MRINEHLEFWLDALEHEPINWDSVKHARQELTTYFEANAFFKKDIKLAVNAIIIKAQELDLI